MLLSPKGGEPKKLRKQRQVRQQVDFGSETHQNRYGCPADTKYQGNPAGCATNKQTGFTGFLLYLNYLTNMYFVL